MNWIPLKPSIVTLTSSFLCQRTQLRCWTAKFLCQLHSLSWKDLRYVVWTDRDAVLETESCEPEESCIRWVHIHPRERALLNTGIISHCDNPSVLITLTLISVLCLVATGSLLVYCVTAVLHVVVACLVCARRWEQIIGDYYFYYQ